MSREMLSTWEYRFNMVDFASKTCFAFIGLGLVLSYQKNLLHDLIILSELILNLINRDSTSHNFIVE
jgi:hypothetical protein